MAAKEEQLYEVVKKWFEDKFRQSKESYFEVTARGISNKLKKVLDDTALHIINVEKSSPDLMGYYLKKSGGVGMFPSTSRKLIVAEIKDRKLKIDDVYQIKKYAEVFNVDNAFLISPIELSEEVRRFLKEQPQILSYSAGCGQITIARFDPDKNELLIDSEVSYLDLFK